MKKSEYVITIIGAGVVGCAVAYELARKGYRNIVVIEKNMSIPGKNQSSRNGGIIHSGIYYPQDIEPLKARLCVEGNQLLYSFCKKYNVPYAKTGKIIVATNKKELAYLDYFYTVGKQNGIKGLKSISSTQAQRMEPNLSNIVGAVYVPSCGSIAPDPYVEALKYEAENYGIVFRTGSEAIHISPNHGHFIVVVRSQNRTYELLTDLVINSAGLFSDYIARLINPQSKLEIIPTRGELFQFDQSIRKDIAISAMHIYPTPYCYYNDSKEIADLPVDRLRLLLKKGLVTKTVGVHISPMFTKIDGKYSIEKYVGVGPIKSFPNNKDDYDSNLSTPENCISKINQIFPHLKSSDLSRRYTGIMAVLKGSTDFYIRHDQKYSNAINLVGMDSPAFTASLAIGRYVEKLLR